MSVNNTTFILYTMIYMSGRHVSTLSVIIRPSKKPNPKEVQLPSLTLCYTFLFFYVLFVLCRPVYCKCVLYYWLATQLYFNLYHFIGKTVPLQAWSGPEGSRKLRFSDFMTTAQDGGKVVSLTHRPPLPPGNAPGTHFC